MAAILSTRFAAAVTDWAASFPLASVTGVQIGHVCVVESELAQVLRVGPGLTLKVLRGTEGTATAAHATATPVAIYRADDVETDAPVLGSAAVALRQATVTLTDAQIKALPTTPVVVIPATETLDYDGTPMQVPVLRAAYLLTNYWPIAYDEPGGTVALTLWLGSDRGAFIIAQMTSSLPGGNVDVIPMTLNMNPTSLVNSLFDNAIILSADPALTEGDPTNTLTVSVLYTVLDVTTGVYI